MEKNSGERNNTRSFLKANWTDLVFVSFRVSPSELQAYVPQGLELDLFDGSAVLSLVAFKFVDTRFFGIRVPWFHSFAELNLRFYVRKTGISGVVFIKEICPHMAPAFVAKLFYNESFSVMNSEMKSFEGEIRYKFGNNQASGGLSVSLPDALEIPAEGSLAQFVSDRYHGFSSWHFNQVIHYTVAHPKWLVAQTELLTFSLPIFEFYDSNLAQILNSLPSSVLYSSGSLVDLSCGQIISNNKESYASARQ